METIEQKLAHQYKVRPDSRLHIKDIDITKRIITGIYNAYNYYDFSGDVLVMGAAAKSIQEHGPEAQSVRKIKHALNHDLKTLPGKIQVLDERTVDFNGNKVTGIYFETKMAQSTIGTDTLINYQEGIYDNHSIGYRYVQLTFVDNESDDWQMYVGMLINPEAAEKEGYMYVVKEIELFEGSTVAIGMNELTPYLGVKGNNPELVIMKINDRIDRLTKSIATGTQSDEMLGMFDVEARQLKQMIQEVYQHSLKGTFKKPLEDETKDFNFKHNLQTIKFFNK